MFAFRESLGTRLTCGVFFKLLLKSVWAEPPVLITFFSGPVLFLSTLRKSTCAPPVFAWGKAAAVLIFVADVR